MDVAAQLAPAIARCLVTGAALFTNEEQGEQGRGKASADIEVSARRNVVLALVRSDDLWTFEHESVLVYCKPPLLRDDDLRWLLVEFTTERSEVARQRLARLVPRVALRAYLASDIDVIVSAAEKSPELAETMAHLLAPIRSTRWRRNNCDATMRHC
jgi:hypothetical protein